MDFHGLRVVDFDSSKYKGIDDNRKLCKEKTETEKSYHQMCVSHVNEKKADQKRSENKIEHKTTRKRIKRNPKCPSKSEIYEAQATNDFRTPSMNESIENLRNKLHNKTLNSTKPAKSFTFSENIRNIGETTINTQHHKKDASINVLHHCETCCFEKAKRSRREKEKPHVENGDLTNKRRKRKTSSPRSRREIEKYHQLDLPYAENKEALTDKRRKRKESCPRPEREIEKSHQSDLLYAKNGAFTSNRRKRKKSRSKSTQASFNQHENFDYFSRKNIVNVAASANPNKNNGILRNPNYSTIYESNTPKQCKNKKVKHNSYDRHEDNDLTPPLMPKAVNWEANNLSNVTRIPEHHKYSRTAQIHFEVPQRAENAMGHRLTKIPDTDESVVARKSCDSTKSVLPPRRCIFNRRRVRRKRSDIFINTRFYKSITSFYFAKILHLPNFGKHCLKYTYIGLLFIIWVPGLLAVTFARLLLSPFIFAFKLATRIRTHTSTVNQQKIASEAEFDHQRKEKKDLSQQNVVEQQTTCSATGSITDYCNTILSKVMKSTKRSKTQMRPPSMSMPPTHYLNRRKRYLLCYYQHRGWIVKPIKLSRTSYAWSRMFNRPTDHYGTPKDRRMTTHKRSRRRSHDVSIFTKANFSSFTNS